MIGVSFAPQLFVPQAQGACERRLLEACNGPENLLRSLRALGVTHVELRSPTAQDTAETLLTAARAVWAAGLAVTLHWALPEPLLPFAESCPAVLPLLEEAKLHQPYVTVTVHSHVTGDETDKRPAAEKTNRQLQLWSVDALRYGFRLALELNRDKKNGDPSVTCEGVLSMLEGLDAQTVGICFDFGHYYSNTRDASQLPPQAFLRRVTHTHIHAMENGVTHYPFGPQAKLPLDAYVQALAGEGYEGIYDLELSFERYPERLPRHALRESLKALKGALYRVQRRVQTGTAVLAAQAQAYPAALQAMAKSLAAQQNDRFYTFCASGQVFCVGGRRFAVDIAIRDAAARNASIAAVRQLLEQIPVVFFTHEHDDHFNFSMLRQLADLDCIWVVGDSLSKELLAASGLRPETLRLVRPGDVFAVNGINVEVFEGRHYDPDGSGTGVPAVSYLLTVGGKRIFLPADLRDYGVDRLPEIAPPDVMFANIWLGRGLALDTDDGAYEEFCDYVAYYQPKRVFLGHLWEAMRTPEDMWRWEHAGRIMDGLARRMPAVTATPIQLFGCYEL